MLNGDRAKRKESVSVAPKRTVDRRSLQRNFRELQSILEGLLFASRNKGITIDDLAEFIDRKKGEEQRESKKIATLEEVERDHIQYVLSMTESSVDAAKILGITTVTLWRRRKEYGMV